MLSWNRSHPYLDANRIPVTRLREADNVAT